MVSPDSRKPAATSDAKWQMSDRFDPRSRALADRHYNRQKVGTPQFVPPGRCLVLYAKTETGEAFWVTSWPFAEYVKHAWAGAWVCSAFRNEGAALSSDLIREAVAITRWYYGEPPSMGIVTFVNPPRVKHKRDPGRCFLRAGFMFDGYTKGGLVTLLLPPHLVPLALAPIGALEIPA